MLDGDSPLIKLAVTGKWCCMLCKRQFPTEKLLGTHCAGSTLHRTNLAEAEASGRIRGGSSAPPPASAVTCVSSGENFSRSFSRCETD